MADTVTTSDKSLQDVTATGSPIPDADTVFARTAGGSMQEPVPGGGSGGGDLPTGDENQVMGFGASGDAAAVTFGPEHWTDFPDGPPVAGIWVAAYMPEANPSMAFGEVSSVAKEGALPMYATAGQLAVTGGSDVGFAASVGQLNDRFPQASREAIDALDENSSVADIIAALQAS